MPVLISKTVIALTIIVLTPPVYVIFFLAIENRILRSDDDAFLVTNLICAVLLATSWILLWRRHVCWTRSRRIKTLALSLAGIAVGGMAYPLVATIIRYGSGEVGIIYAGICWAATWLCGTAIVWRETPVEQATRITKDVGSRLPCPTCGYNMTGLNEIRCPECGTEYTLDEFVSSLDRNGLLPKAM